MHLQIKENPVHINKPTTPKSKCSRYETLGTYER